MEVLVQGEDALTQEQPMHLLLLDLTGDGQYLEMVKNGLPAALDAMPSTAFVAMCVFSDTLGVYDLRSPFPHVRRVRIPEDDLPHVELSEVMSLDTMVVDLDQNVEHL